MTTTTTSSTSSAPFSVSPATVRDAGKKLTHAGWHISTTKYPILNASEIDSMTAALGIAPPEMIFGNNSVSLTHGSSGFSISFNAQDALDVVDKNGVAFKVAYSESWQKMRERTMAEEIKDVVKPFDWTFSTDWKGRVVAAGEEAVLKEDEDARIPIEKLKLPDPILLFDEVMLYEDELADNGMSMLSVKIRVMPERLLCLQRFFMRLDDVVVRVRDTRVYVEFRTGEVIREYSAREASYADIKKQFAMYPQDEVPGMMRDPNKLVDLLPVVETVREKGVVK